MTTKACRHVMFFFLENLVVFHSLLTRLCSGNFFYVLFNLVINFFLFLLGFIALLLYFFAKIVAGILVPSASGSYYY